MALTATSERDLDRSPTSSTSLLPVGGGGVGAHRKLNGQCVFSGSDDDDEDEDDTGETSFIAARSDGYGDVVAAGPAAAAQSSVNHVCVPSTSHVGDEIEMSPLPGGAAAAASRLDSFYIDTKGADDSSAGLGRKNQTSDVSMHSDRCTSSSSPPTSVLGAVGSRPTYSRVADCCALPPEVEQLRRDCVSSAAPSSSDVHGGKFV